MKYLRQNNESDETIRAFLRDSGIRGFRRIAGYKPQKSDFQKLPTLDETSFHVMKFNMHPYYRFGYVINRWFDYLGYYRPADTLLPQRIYKQEYLYSFVAPMAHAGLE